MASFGQLFIHSIVIFALGTASAMLVYDARAADKKLSNNRDYELPGAPICATQEIDQEVPHPSCFAEIENIEIETASIAPLEYKPLKILTKNCSAMRTAPAIFIRFQYAPHEYCFDIK